MGVSASLLNKIFDLDVAQAETLSSSLSCTMKRYDITTIKRKASFLAQVAYESGNFRAKVENLNYSVKGLMAVFGKYFSSEAVAKQYARKQKMIGNRVYANRMGNGNEKSGDGYKFKGRGYIQLTGRNNYTAFAKDIGLSLNESIQYLETVEGAVMSAGWFWDTNNLNAVIDTGDFKKLTRRINGGYNGLDKRQALYDKILKELS